jgi:hypothetical protein
MLLILSHPEDVHVEPALGRLRARGAEVACFGWSQFPAAARLVARRDSAGGSLELACDGGRLALDAVGAIWFRRPLRPVVSAQISDPLLREYAQRECLDFLEDVFQSLDASWLPAPVATLRFASLKARQLALAATVGFAVPDTIITNDPQAFLAFYDKHGGQVISKLAGGALHSLTAASVAAGTGRLTQLDRLTEPVTRNDLPFADSVALGPVVFQQLVPKAYELRVTVVGTRLLTARIDSQKSARARLDWRRYDLDRTPHAAATLPADVAERCLRLTARLGLSFGAIDLIVTPDGEHVFLELNPVGQYLWLEKMTGLPITEAICDQLIASADARARARAA